MANLTLRMLGAFSMDRDGRPIRFGYDKMRALLAYLSVEHERPHRRQSLAALFWPEHDKRTALGNLSQALYKLRRALGDRGAEVPLLRVNPQTLQLNPDAEIWIDAVEFANLIGACRSHTHVDPATCGDCLARLSQTASLYRGPFLNGIAVDDSPEFDEWLLMVRERYQRLAGETLRTLANGFEHREQHDKALDYARQRIHLEPWEEEGHRQIMRLHLATGDRSAALSQYEACRRVLATELAVEPSAATTALYQHIRNLDAEHAPTADQNNLPTPLTPLIGRADELAALKARLALPSCRLITLVGPGGSGKTRLAIEAAAQSALRFAHGVLFVPLVSVDTADAVAPALANALDLSLAGNEKPYARVIDYLRRRQMLLLLDNFEHLIGCQSLVVDILRAAPQVKILITSRARLNAPAEQVIAVSGLQIPQPLSQATTVAPSLLAETGAVSLFLYHVRRERPDYVPEPDSLDAIVCICRLVAGMPLGILLAAAWMDVLAPAEIAARLAGDTGDVDTAGIDLLETDSPGLPERQRSIRAVFEHTWSLLTPPDQRVFAALSVFRGSFTYNAAKAVAKATLRQIKSYIDRSLLQRHTDGRYEIHELLRQYAFEQLSDCPTELDRAADRHATFFSDLAHDLGEALRGSRQLEAVKAMDGDADNMRIAWEWAVQRGHFAVIEQAMDGLLAFYGWRGHLQTADRMCHLARELFERDGQPTPNRTYARLLTWHAHFLRLLGHIDKARALLDQSIDMLGEPNDGDLVTYNARAATLGEMSALEQEADRTVSDRLSDQSLALYRRAANRWGTAMALHHRGQVVALMSDFDSAQRFLMECLTLSQSLGDRRLTAAVLRDLANVHGRQGRLARGEELGRQSIAIYEELGDRFSAAICTVEFAALMAYAGHFERALRLFEEALAGFEYLGARRQFALTLHLAGWMNLNLGCNEAAEAHNQQASEIFEALGERHGRALTCLSAGENLLVRKDYHAAASILSEGAAHFQELEQWDEYAITRSVLALAQLELGDYAEARQSVFDALKAVRRIGAFAPAHMAIDAQAAILANAGDIERAVEYHALVFAHPYFGNSVFRKAVTGQTIDRCASVLSLERVRAAEERGLARDVWVTVDEILAEYETAATHEAEASPC